MKLLICMFFLFVSYRVEAIIEVYPGDSCSEVIAKNKNIIHEKFISQKVDNNTAYAFIRTYEGHDSTTFFECNENEVLTYRQTVNLESIGGAKALLDAWHNKLSAVLGISIVDSRKSNKGTDYESLKKRGVFHQEAQLILWEVSGYSQIALNMDDINDQWELSWAWSK